MTAPNTVQRGARKVLASDDMLRACAEEGGTFREPTQRAATASNDPGPEYTPRAAIAAFLVLCVMIAAYCIFGEAS